MQNIYFSKFYGKVGVLSWLLFNFIWKNYVLNWDFDSKSWIVDFFTRFTREKTPQNNFSHQNFSVENNYFYAVEKLEFIGLTSYARNSQKKQYLIFGEMRIFFFSFAYLSAVWLLFGQNPIEIILDNIFLLDFAQTVTKQLIDKQNWKIFLISP